MAPASRLLPPAASSGRRGSSHLYRRRGVRAGVRHSRRAPSRRLRRGARLWKNGRWRRESSSWAYLSNVSVAKDLQRNGLGYALVDKSKKLAREWGITDLYVHVAINNEAAKKLCNKCGFVYESEEPAWNGRLGFLTGFLFGSI
ncbi:hypothetical protein GUJ93_ZPchr0010g9544 [Zizania palustris]|uniref:N-acetyltransferase domain-containing protein n=1 Tax=Zizania palustris TaxID=103762 RepID=A0A8J5WEY9_ZIZPA|nr:hypothetical protein GUJ93_ZPchr0010g9544 [Zizania palustris]